jgi:CMP-N-acetylneuraminic acid synthetase
MQAYAAGVDLTLVTTDDPKILSFRAQQKDFFEIEPRAMDLSQDDSPIETVISDVLARHTGYDAFVLLNPTHPLRHVDDIKACISALEDFPSCTGVRKDYSYTVDEGARHSNLNEQGRVPRLVVTGAIYAVRVPAFLERRKLMITGNVNRGRVHIERGPYIDIDTEEDLVAARALWDHARRAI